jgi:hypothetical protein
MAAKKQESVMVRLRCTYDNGERHGPGEVIALAEAEAARLVAGGYAEMAEAAEGERDGQNSHA